MWCCIWLFFGTRACLTNMRLYSYFVHLTPQPFICSWHTIRDNGTCQHLSSWGASCHAVHRAKDSLISLDQDLLKTMNSSQHVQFTSRTIDFILSILFLIWNICNQCVFYLIAQKYLIGSSNGSLFLHMFSALIKKCIFRGLSFRTQQTDLLGLER